MFEVLLARLRVAENEIILLRERVSGLEDKLDVVEEHTCENYNALTELNEWKDKVDDKLEEHTRENNNIIKELNGRTDDIEDQLEDY